MLKSSNVLWCFAYNSKSMSTIFIIPLSWSISPSVNLNAVFSIFPIIWFVYLSSIPVPIAATLISCICRPGWLTRAPAPCIFSHFYPTSPTFLSLKKFGFDVFILLCRINSYQFFPNIFFHKGEQSKLTKDGLGLPPGHDFPPERFSHQKQKRNLFLPFIVSF